MKKIKYKIAVPIVIVLGLLLYIFLTPVGALRFAVFREAFVGKMQTDFLLAAINLEVDYSDECAPCPVRAEPVREQYQGDNPMLYYIKGAPVAPLTETEFDMWVVCNYGIFYWSEPYEV